MRVFSRRSYVCASWLRLLAPPPCCHAATGHWMWLRPSRSSIQLPRPTSGSCDGTAPVSTPHAPHCSGQRLSVRRSLMGVQACRQQARPTTHVRCSSTTGRRSYPSTLTSLSCRRWLTQSRSMWICRAVVDAVPPSVDGPSRRLRPRCDRLPRLWSMRLGALYSVVVLIVQTQGEMKRTRFDVGMRCKRRGGEICSS